MSLNSQEIIKKLSKVLSEKRFIHTMGVAYTATSLAMAYNTDIKKAELAGLLHDCAKWLSHKEMLEAAEKYEMSITDLEYNSANLLHSKVGAVLAREEYKVEDDEIVSAIAYHTTGKPEMTMLEKIVFIADYIEPSRVKQKRLDQIRKVAFENIDKALYYILEDTMEYLKDTNTDIDPLTEQTYLYYKEIV